MSVITAAVSFVLVLVLVCAADCSVSNLGFLASLSWLREVVVVEVVVEMAMSAC